MNTIINCFQKKGPAAAEFRVVFVLGGPGSGKGTMCAKIVDKYGWVHLSAGDLLRAERKDPTSKNGELINDFIKEGKIVPVEITRVRPRPLALIRQAMEASGSRNFLIDGFPRSADNLQGWEANMADCADVARTTEAVMQERILRRSAETVAAGGAARSDDNVDAIKKRFATYHESTMPIIEIFKARDKVTLVDSTPAADAVFAEVCALFDKF
ncbi:hypothetical protein AURANDRAFT_22358 [Aureococcus anophagefferens]|uniref:Uncharacterized protein n=1 Tax=Aureococcus anophagefferens TaxID=44056 RepID=F0Y2S9_AURAN|nr:hypothetical protein AURANDRAFT_22358 [Aureococcus anophagefferens]EGB11016.1 hypothetical protein AURANDRAFT_22358 [Aureococcus anophagefferens]|eukprot:XP_009034575.1 hypothetical protein AURANDRAFT_22358 [Aureococcus anophagefferens]